MLLLLLLKLLVVVVALILMIILLLLLLLLVRIPRLQRISWRELSRGDKLTIRPATCPVREAATTITTTLLVVECCTRSDPLFATGTCAATIAAALKILATYSLRWMHIPIPMAAVIVRVGPIVVRIDARAGITTRKKRISSCTWPARVIAVSRILTES